MMTWVWRVVLLVIALLALLTIPSPGFAAPQANEHADAVAGLTLTGQRGDVIAVGRRDGANPGTIAG